MTKALKYRIEAEAVDFDLKEGKNVIYVKSFIACMFYIIKHSCDEIVAVL